MPESWWDLATTGSLGRPIRDGPVFWDLDFPVYQLLRFSRVILGLASCPLPTRHERHLVSFSLAPVSFSWYGNRALYLTVLCPNPAWPLAPTPPVTWYLSPFQCPAFFDGAHCGRLYYGPCPSSSPCFSIWPILSISLWRSHILSLISTGERRARARFN